MATEEDPPISFRQLKDMFAGDTDWKVLDISLVVHKDPDRWNAEALAHPKHLFFVARNEANRRYFDGIYDQLTGRMPLQPQHLIYDPIILSERGWYVSIFSLRLCPIFLTLICEKDTHTKQCIKSTTHKTPR